MNIPDLRGFTPDAFQAAVATYLRLAYPNGALPEPVQKRLEWPPPDSMERLLSAPQFERGLVAGTKTPVFALRLGNQFYPHMKLQLQPWPTTIGAMLSVNTHDQILGLDAHATDAAAFRALQAANQEIKESIEQAWDQQGLPTFLRYLRDYIALII